jgi:Tol biopolymer transport system component
MMINVRRSIPIVVFFALLGTQAGATFQAQDPGVFLRAAIEKEEVDGDLQAAIDQYKLIVAKFADNHPIAAKALIRLGGCYEKLGAEQAGLAKQAFQKVVEDYPDQKEAVNVAKEKLILSLMSPAVRKPGAAEFSLRQVWAGPEVDIDGAVSPDGRYLSFVDWKTGDVALRDLISGTNRRLTDKGSLTQPLEFALFLKWAPDSRRIAYQWGTEEGRYELRLLDIEDPTPRVLYRARNFKEEYIHPFDWSPDGRSILMGAYRIEDMRPTYISQVELISVADGSAKTLKTQIAAHFEKPKPWGFVFSPDGKYIAYDVPMEDKEDNRDIFLLSVEGGQEVRLVDHPARDTVIGWMPGGEGLLFSSDRTGTNDMWFVRVAGGKPMGSPQLIKPNIGSIFPLGITTRGALYYGISGYMNDVYEVGIDPRTGNILSPVKKAILKDEGSNAYPDYSPDGKSLAYIFSPRGPGRPSGQSLRIRSLETGRIQELAFDLIRFGYPRWAPDGRFISVEGAGRDGRQGIFRVDIRTGDIVPVVLIDTGRSIFSHRWSQDGRSLFYTVGDPEGYTGSIFVHRFQTGQNEPLSGSPSNAHDIDISPDGKWLVFLNRMGKRTIRIMPTSGGAPREICGFEHMERRIITPAWSADGRYIYFSKLPSVTDLWEFYRISAEEGDALKLDLAMGGFRHLSVHPDGQRVAFSSDGPNYGQAQVWVMENFLPAAKEKK